MTYADCKAGTDGPQDANSPRQKMSQREPGAAKKVRPKKSITRLLTGAAVSVGLIVCTVSPASAAGDPIVLPSSQSVAIGRIGGDVNQYMSGTVTRSTNKAVYTAFLEYYKGNGITTTYPVVATFTNSPTGTTAQTCTATGGGQTRTVSVGRNLPAVSFGALPPNTTSSQQFVTTRGTGYRVAQTLAGPVYDFVSENALRLRTYQRTAIPSVDAQRANMVANITTQIAADAIMRRLEWAGMRGTGATAIIAAGVGFKESVAGSTIIVAGLFAACGIAVAGGWYNNQEVNAVAAGVEYNGQFDRIWSVSAGALNPAGWQRLY